MKKILLNSLIAIAAIILVSGCSAKRVSMKALKPAPVTAVIDKRVLAVTEFKGDKVGLSTKVEGVLASIEIDKKKYFKVPNRSAMNKILKEQKFGASDLSNGKNAAKIGKLAGAQAIIVGSVDSSFGDSSYQETRQRCAAYTKKGCARYESYRVTCTTATAKVSADMNIISVETGVSLHAENITKNYNGDSCKDGKTSLGIVSFGGDKKVMSGSQGVSALATQVAQEFATKLAPSYVYYSVELMEKLKSIKVTDKQEKQFENSIAYIENKRIEKAEKILEKLNTQLNESAFEVTYNLGLIKQSKGDYKIAKALYTLTDELIGKPNKLVDAAFKKIDQLIAQEAEAKKQLN